jgi:hypothetical protein
LPATYFRGDSYGQGKEACRAAQEKLETRQSKRQACAQDGSKAHDAEKGKIQGPGRGGTAPKHAVKKKRPPKIAARKPPRNAPKQVVAPVEDTIIDVIDEPVPGVVVVTEYESIRTATPISSARKPKRDDGPKTEE